MVAATAFQACASEENAIVLWMESITLNRDTIAAVIVKIHLNLKSVLRRPSICSDRSQFLVYKAHNGTQ